MSGEEEEEEEEGAEEEEDESERGKENNCDWKVISSIPSFPPFSSSLYFFPISLPKKWRETVKIIEAFN